VRAAAERAVASVRQGVRRQASARVARARSGRPPGHVVAVVGLAPVVARVQPDLRLEEHREALVARLLAALGEAGVVPWWLPGAQDERDVLCVRSADSRTVLRTVAALATPGWYVDPLDATGVQSRRYVLARQAGGLDVPGLLVWEFVTPAAGSTFVADERQGLRIIFWDDEDAADAPEAQDGGVGPGGGQAEAVVARVANPVAERLPTASVVAGGVPPELRHRSTTRVDFPVDVVYTWVDGEDDAWLLDKAHAAGVADPALFTERAHDASRFADHDELRHSLRSLEQFAPWVNHVWVVTAGQHPSWLAQDHPWVSVVDHRAIFPGGEGLPTFNSHAIEACLHRIPGLAEHFLYLNDDMLLGRPVRADQFFHANGVGKFFWSRALVDHGPTATGDIASTTAARNARRLLEEHLGVTFSRKFFHTAAALTVSGLAELEATFPDVVAATRRARFRTLDDVALAGSFYLNWAYATGRSVPGRVRYTYIDPAAPDARARLRSLSRTRVFDAFCVNDGSSEETPEQRRETDRLIRAFFAEYLPVPGTFEV
jgi:hypothetical protein